MSQCGFVSGHHMFSPSQQPYLWKEPNFLGQIFVKTRDRRCNRKLLSHNLLLRSCFVVEQRAGVWSLNLSESWIDFTRSEGEVKMRSRMLDERVGLFTTCVRLSVRHTSRKSADAWDPSGDKLAQSVWGNVWKLIQSVSQIVWGKCRSPYSRGWALGKRVLISTKMEDRLAANGAS